MRVMVLVKATDDSERGDFPEPWTTGLVQVPHPLARAAIANGPRAVGQAETLTDRPSPIVHVPICHAAVALP